MAGASTEWANRRLRSVKQVQGAFAFLGEAQERGGAFDFGEVSPEVLHAAVKAWCNQGYAISFGRTSDGGAGGIHLVANGVKRSLYGASVDELEHHLATVAASGGDQTE